MLVREVGAAGVATEGILDAHLPLILFLAAQPAARLLKDVVGDDDTHQQIHDRDQHDPAEQLRGQEDRSEQYIDQNSQNTMLVEAKLKANVLSLEAPFLNRL